MTQKPDQNTCYVFSDQTLDEALKDWLTLKKTAAPKQEESYLITAAALPWFLKHCELTAPIYMFTYQDLARNIEMWKAAQLVAFPHREERIAESCKLLMEFFQSEIMLTHKMIVQA